MRAVSSMRRRLAILACLAALPVAASASVAAEATQRFQIVTGDDSDLTRAIADDLQKRLAPIFSGFRADPAQ